MRQAMPAFMKRPRLGMAAALAILLVAGAAEACSQPAHSGGDSPDPSPAHRTGGGAKDFAQAGNIRAQNALPGDPYWRVSHSGPRRKLEGFASRTDVLPGVRFRLFVSTTARSFRVLAFRMGWHGGDLARLVWTSPGVVGRLQSRGPASRGRKVAGSHARS